MANSLGLQASEAPEASQPACGTLSQQGPLQRLSFGNQILSIVPDNAIYDGSGPLFRGENATHLGQHFADMNTAEDPSWLFVGVGWHGTPPDHEAKWHLTKSAPGSLTKEILDLARKYSDIMSQHPCFRGTDARVTDWTALAMASLLRLCIMVQEEQIPHIPVWIWLLARPQGHEGKVTHEVLRTCMSEALGHVEKFLTKLHYISDGDGPIWELFDAASPPEEQNKVLLEMYGMPRTSSSGFTLCYLDGQMPKERLMEFTAAQLPLCDRIWFDSRTVTSSRASEILQKFKESSSQGKLTRARKLEGSVWVSSGEDMVLIIDAAIPYPLCNKNPANATLANASVKAFQIRTAVAFNRLQVQGAFETWQLGPEGDAFKIGDYTLDSFLGYGSTS